MTNDWAYEVAIHEAGHAVIGRVLDMTCGYATVAANDDYAGHTICADPMEIAQHWENREKYRDISLVFRGRILAYMLALTVLCDGNVAPMNRDDFQRKPLAKSRSEKRPPLNVETARNSLSQWPARATAVANRRK
jgi:hypothetical protein